MIDLNYLYVYCTSRAKRRAPHAVEYLSASALVRQEKQNFSRYFDAIFTERMENCSLCEETPLAAVDVFLMALENSTCSISDFVAINKRVESEKFNVVDEYFYHLMPYNRIFSAFNELRARGNTAFFPDVVRPDKVRLYEEICDADFLFTEPVLSGYSAYIRGAIGAMFHTDKSGESPVRVSPSDVEKQTLYSTFFLTEKNGRLGFNLDDNTPEFIRNAPERCLRNICQLIGWEKPFLSVIDGDLLEMRNVVFEQIIDNTKVGLNWEYCDNYLDGLQAISQVGQELFTNDRAGKMIPLFEACENGINYYDEDDSLVDEVVRDDWTRLADFRVTKNQCDAFKNRIVGQDSAKNEIIDKLVGVACGFYTGKRPVASFLMNGPTGVGKTETAKALADTFFGGRLFTIDMGTFKNACDVSRLIGSAPGYIGYDDKVGLLEFLEKNPNGVLNFDEIDKCDRSCLSFLLSLLDEGKFASAKGRDYSVENFVITCTTNQKAQISRKSENFNLDEMMSRTGENGTPFVKEFLGRFDALLEYDDLTKTELKAVLGQKLDARIELFNKNNPKSHISIEYRDRLLEDILQDANYKATGARSLNGSIQKLFVRPISHYLLENTDRQSEQKIVVAGDNKLLVNNDCIETVKASTDSNEQKTSSNEITNAMQRYYA